MVADAGIHLRVPVVSCGQSWAGSLAVSRARETPLLGLVGLVGLGLRLEPRARAGLGGGLAMVLLIIGNRNRLYVGRKRGGWVTSRTGMKQKEKNTFCAETNGPFSRIASLRSVGTRVVDAALCTRLERLARTQANDVGHAVGKRGTAKRRGAVDHVGHDGLL